MQTKLHLSRLQHVDANGSPIVGSLGFYQTGTSTEITTYSDYDRQTTNANPLNADSNGRFGPVFFDPSDLRTGVKVVLYPQADGAGTPVYSDDRYQEDVIEWADISSVITKTKIGEVFYDRTDAEIFAGIAAYDAANSIGDITNPEYPPCNVLRYGADPTGATNSRAAVQACLNVASHGADGDERTAYFPDGVYLCDTAIYTYHDTNNNPNYKSGAFYQGRIEIRGGAFPDQNNWKKDNDAGSIIRFSQATGNCFLAGYDMHNPPGSASAYEHRALNLKNIQIDGQTSGTLFFCPYNPQANWENVIIGNDGSGVAVEWAYNYTCNWKQVYILGPGSKTSGTNAGIGLRYKSGEFGITTAAPGLNVFENMTIGGFATGTIIGDEFNSAYTGSIGGAANRFESCQWSANDVAVQCRRRSGGHEFVNCYFELSTDVDIWLTDSAGIREGLESGSWPGIRQPIRVIGGSVSSNTTGCTHIRLGRQDGSYAEENRFGWIVLDGVDFLYNGGSTGAVIEAYDVKGSGGIVLNGVHDRRHSGAPTVKYLDDSADHFQVIVRDAELMVDKPSNQQFYDSSGTNQWGNLNSGGYINVPARMETSNTELDYTWAQCMPERIFCDVTTGNTQTIKLPAVKNYIRPFMTVISKTDDADGVVSIEVLQPSWVSGTEYTDNDRIESGGNTYSFAGLADDSTGVATSVIDPASLTYSGGYATDGNGLGWFDKGAADSWTISGAATYAFDGQQESVLLVCGGISPQMFDELYKVYPLGGKRQAYNASPSNSEIRDILIATGLMASS